MLWGPTPPCRGCRGGIRRRVIGRAWRGVGGCLLPPLRPAGPTPGRLVTLLWGLMFQQHADYLGLGVVGQGFDGDRLAACVAPVPAVPLKAADSLAIGCA